MDAMRQEAGFHVYYSVDTIAQRSELPVDETHKALTFLGATRPKEAEYKTGFGPFRYRITEHGTLAIHSTKHLSEGKEKKKTDLLRWSQIGGILVTIFIGIATLFLNLSKRVDTPIPTQKLLPLIRQSPVLIPAPKISTRKSLPSKTSPPTNPQ
jgi:hypothetical protein